MKNKNLFGLLALFLFLLIPIGVKAGNGNVYLSGNGTYYPNKTFTIDVNGNASSGNLMGIGGLITSSNPNCVQIQSISKVELGSDTNGSKFSYLYGDGFSGTRTIVRLNLKSVGQLCNSNITISQLTLSFTDGTNLRPSNVTKTINVSAPPSTNNNLNSLTVSAGSLSPGFSAGTTSYTVNVDNTVSSINIGATAADAKASVSGAGQKNLNYGSNTFSINVKAESGDTKTYTINVIRKDNRSTDNNLKNISISNGSLSPGFNANTTSYSVSVPFDVTKLNISANPSDAKATVSINNPDLIAEKTVNVVITVKAENGSTKTYTISVSRGKDPNKILSTDNKLLSLVPSVGILSPSFSPDKNNYYVYLPFEIDKINFEYEVSDKTYATVKQTGEEELIPESDNYYSFTVTAEDGSENTYTVTVNRAKNHDGDNNDEVLKKIKAQEESQDEKCNTNGSNKVALIIFIITTVLFAALSTLLLLDKFDILHIGKKIDENTTKEKKNNKK